ncbi:hypothetical protein [Mucilaginibacter defluvii]|uniref:Lipoprotein n=1 Tax=Mucilaginibacter defluvii TaxID=1196019 RepID=A0ABP9G124_9SPHI
MKNLLVQFASVITVTFLLSGCLKKTDEAPIGCDPAVTAFPFQIKDGATNADLFFGASAKYKPSELKLFPENYTGEKDSIPVIRLINSTRQGFIIYPSIKTRDTILVRIAAMAPDTLTFKLSQPADACHPWDISEVTFKGKPVASEDLYVLKK